LSAVADIPAGDERRPMAWVLVVDDDDDNRDLVLEILDDAGYLAKGANGGASALALLRDEQPCLVLADLVMDDMDGKALQNEVRRLLDDRTPPFIFVTGVSPSTLDDISGTFLTKPIEIDQLLNAVAQHCGPADPAS
jgi:two-component system response regulator GlrR